MNLRLEIVLGQANPTLEENQWAKSAIEHGDNVHGLKNDRNGLKCENFKISHFQQGKTKPEGLANHLKIKKILSVY